MASEVSPVHGLSYHLLSYDADGVERLENGTRASDVLIGTARLDEVSDVFIFSHGWNGDVADARTQYGKWIDTMAERTDDLGRLAGRDPKFHPLLVGVHWPSKPWGDEDLGRGSFAAGDETSAETGDPLDRLVNDYAGRLGDSPDTRAAIRRIVEAARLDAVPATLPPEVRAAYHELNDLLAIRSEGEGSAPGDDRAPFDSEETYQTALMADIIDPVSYAGFSLGGILAPLRVLSFWTMKRRAMLFGQSAAANLLSRLHTALPDARLHLAGHSFGCIVASAAVAGPPATAGSRPGAGSLVLIQGAMSLWSFWGSIPVQPDRSGYFHRIIEGGLVRGPFIATTSVHDRAVRVFYPLGAGVRGQIDFAPSKLPTYGCIGTFGVRGPGIECVDDELQRVDDSYEFHSGAVYNLNADSVIATSSGISGAHSDICHPEVARVIWRAVEVSIG